MLRVIMGHSQNSLLSTSKIGILRQLFEMAHRCKDFNAMRGQSSLWMTCCIILTLYFCKAWCGSLRPFFELRSQRFPPTLAQSRGQKADTIEASKDLAVAPRSNRIVLSVPKEMTSVNSPPNTSKHSTRCLLVPLSHIPSNKSPH